MTEPIVEGSGSLADQIMAGLTSQGYTAGSLADREHKRLADKLELSEIVAQTFTLQDLYELAEEPVRIAGET